MSAASEVRRGVVFVVATLILSALAGVAWGALAPAEHLVRTRSGALAALTGESNHRFDALALFVCVGFGLGFVVAVMAWTTLRLRGPRWTAAVVGAGAVGACVCAGVGLGVAVLLHPRVTDPAVGDVVAAAPGLSTLLALVAQPLFASITTVVLVTLSSDDDLGPVPDRSVDASEVSSAV